MKLRRKITEANIAPKILADPRQTKMLALAMRHDETIPRHKIARLGPKATDAELVQLWSEMLDQSLADTKYGDLSRDSKFDAWLTRLYLNHSANYEDVNGEAGDALGAWKALSIRDLLEPSDQDFNKFTSLAKIQKMVRKPKYARELKRLADQEIIEKAKRDAKAITLIDDDRFKVDVPLNTGSCYVFNTAEGVDATYCTGASQRETYFPQYSRNGPIVQILDKKNMNDVKGKWQMHTASSQLKQADQRNHQGSAADQEFAKLFPGLMKKIAKELNSKSEELKTKSSEMDIARGGWNIPEEIGRIKQKYPTAYNSKAKGEEDEDDISQGPAGTREWNMIVNGVPREGEIIRAGTEEEATELMVRRAKQLFPNAAEQLIRERCSVSLRADAPARPAADREWTMIVNGVYRPDIIRAPDAASAMDEAVRVYSTQHPNVSPGIIRNRTRVVDRTPQTIFRAGQERGGPRADAEAFAEPEQQDGPPRLWSVMDQQNNRSIVSSVAARTRDQAYDRFLEHLRTREADAGWNNENMRDRYYIVPAAG